MKKGLVVLGVVLFLGGLVALLAGLTALNARPCFVGGDCSPTSGDNIARFPLGLTSVILGSAAWSAGASGRVGTGSVRNPLAIVGFFGIFGLTFFGVGVVMLVADQQLNADHTTNVLTILGIVFGIVGLGSMAAEVAFRLSGAANARILATGIRGSATVTAVRDTNVTVNMNPMVALDLRVEIPGQPVFTTTMRQVISRLQAGSFQPGMVLSVAASRTRPRDIVSTGSTSGAT